MVEGHCLHTPVGINKISPAVTNMGNRDLLTEDQRGGQRGAPGAALSRHILTEGVAVGRKIIIRILKRRIKSKISIS